MNKNLLSSLHNIKNKLEKVFVKKEITRIKNIITPFKNGPLHVTGALILKNNNGEVLEECEELYLCRCGNSNKKPYCDGEHKRAEFKDCGALKKPPPTETGLKNYGPLEISVHANGPLVIKGAVSIQDADCSKSVNRNICGLCRCGHSGNSPFCDGTHSQIEFNVD